jgi:hypothetical protein
MATISNVSTGDIATEAWADSVADGMNRVGVSVTRVANQSIATGTGTFTAITWDTEVQDNGGFFTASSANLTVPSGKEGIYIVTSRIAWASSPGANSIIEILYGATTWRTVVGAATQSTSCSISACLALAAADTINIRVSQGSGGAINVTGACQMWRVAL